MYSRSILFERVLLALLRGLATVVATFASVWVWHSVLQDRAFTPSDVYIVPSLVIAATVIVVTWSLPSRFHGLSDEFVAIARSTVLAVLIVTALSFFVRSETYSRGTALVFIPMAILALLVADAVDRRLSTRLQLNSAASRRVLLIGFDTQGQRVAASLALRPIYYTVVGYVDRRVLARSGGSDIPRLGSIEDVREILSAYAVDEAIIAAGYASDEELRELIGICMGADTTWKVVPPMLGLCLDQVQFDSVGGLPIVGERGSQLVGHNWYLKRGFDILGSVLLLMLLSPIMAAAVLAIRLTSRGPAIFRQSRVGLRGHAFTLYKFRTMAVESDASVHQSAATDWVFGDAEADKQGNGASHKNHSDSRITPVGRILRSTSIDELPQLWNVTKGEMSLVGPRPPIDYEVSRYAEWHKRRLEVPPGMTGLWQVSGRNSLSFDEMVELDIDYIDGWSVGLDVRILLRTIPAVVVDRGR